MRLKTSLFACILATTLSFPAGAFSDAPQKKAGDSQLLQNLNQTSQWLNQESPSLELLPEACLPKCTGSWWTKFNDPSLNELLTKGLEHNKDIAIARANLAEARGQLRSDIADEIPDLSITGTYSRQRNVYTNNASSSSSSSSGGNNGFQVLAPNVTSKVFSAPLRVAYDADIWLKHRDTSRAQKRRVESSAEELQSAQLNVMADIASAYFQYRGSTDLVSLFEAGLIVAKADLVAAEAQVEYGLKTPDVAAAKAKQLSQLESQLSQLRQLKSTTQSQLAILTGQLPTAFDIDTEKHLEEIPLQSIIPTGTPASIIFQRPDLRQQSLELEAANIDVRVARKAFLPSLNLSGQLGYNSINIGTFSLQSLAWNAAASLAQSLFTGGSKRADVKIAKAKRDKAFHTFEKQLLTASKEVDDAIAGLKNSHENLKQQLIYDDATAKQDAIQLARMEAGAIAKNIYYAQRLQTLEAKAQRIQSYLATLNAEVSLYKALGGGY